MDDLNIQAGVTVNAEQAERAFDNLGNKAQKMANEVTKAADKAGKATDGMGDGAEKGAEKFTRAESRMRAAIQKSTRELEMLGKTASQKFEAQLEFKGLDKAKFQPFLAELRKTEEAAAKAQAGVSGIGDAAKVAGSMMAAAFSGAALLGVVGKVVSVQREFDVLNSSLKTVTGSSAAAEREMAWLKDFAKETPFGLAQATQGFVKMKALGLDPTRAALTSFGNTASAMGKDLNQMIEAVADASTGEFERLKEFGVKAKKEGDNVSLTFQGVTTTIKNSAAEITAYLEKIGNNQFGGAMEERAKTLDGTIAALGDTWDELFRTISSNNVGSLIFDSITLANGVLEDATTIVRAFGGASADAARNTGALTASQGAIATFFETVAVMGAETLYVLKQTGDTLGGLAAGYKAFFSFDFDAVRAIGAEMRANGEAARKEIDATTARILNARKEQEEYSRYATRNASASTDPRRIDLDKPSRASSSGSSGGGSAKGAKEAVSEYDKLIQRLGVDLPKAAAEAEAAQMGYNKAQAEFIALAGSDAWAKFSNTQRATVAALYETKIASEQAGDAAKKLAKAEVDAVQAREKYLASLATGIDKIKADIAAQEEATARMGLSKEAIAELDAAKLEMLATDLELQAIKAMDRNLDQQTYDSLKEQARLYRELGIAKRGGAAKEAALELEKANTDAAKDAAREWDRAAADINRSLTDALLRGFESGKDFAKNLRDTVVNMFKTLVLRPIISAVVNPVAGAITGALGLSGTAQAASGGSSLLGNVGSIVSGANSLGLLGSIGATVSGAVGSAIGAFSGGLVAANAATATLITGSAASAAAAAAGAATAGGAAASAAASAASAGSSIASTLGVLGPLALGAGALLLIGKATKGETRTGGQFGVAFDGSVTNQRRDQTYTIEGQQFDRDFTNGLQTALKDGIAYRLEGDPVAHESAIREAVAGTASGINGFLKALGSSATLTGFSAGLETSGKGRGGVFAGGMLSNGAAFGESGKGDNYAGTLYEKFSTSSPDFKTALENFTLDLKQSTIQALQTVSDIPEAVQKLLKGVDAEGLTEDAANKLLETINAQIVGVNQFKDALKGMGLDTLAALSFDAAAGLAEVSGGFDKLLGNLQTYYTNFFTGEEQRANLQRSLAQQLSTLGLQLPDINASNARDQFRALVSAAENDMSESGRKTYATLLALSGAFASITEAAQTTTQTLEQQRQAYYGALQDAVSARNKNLQSQLSAAQDVASTLENLFGILRSNVRELYREVDGTRGMLASQGNAFIDQALATAKASGYLPDADKLAEAIGAVRGGMDGRAYTTQFAADRDRLVLAGKLSGLEGIAEKQLTDAQKTVRALETQIEQNEQVLDYWKQQIDIANGTYQGILSVESAVQQLSGFLGGTGSTRPTTATGSLGGEVSGPGYRDRGTVARADYGADVALSSFDKFKAWYQGLATNANVGALQSAGYQVPDWMRVGGMAGDSTDKELFGSYLYFKNNPQFAKDFEQVMTTGRSSLPTDGSTLVRSDLSKMPTDAAEFFKNDRNSLLSYESFGLDPVLAYKLYKDGPGQFGLDIKRENFTEWLRTHKWTEGGIVESNNTLDTAKPYAGYNLARYDTSTGNIVNLDGTIYSPDGKYLGMAGRDLMTSVYGSAFLGTSGGSYGDATRSALYNSQVQGGATEADYYNAIKTGLDAAIAGGQTAQDIANAISSTGASMHDVAAAYGISVAQLEANLRAGGATNIPKFDVGTNYVPRDMLAYIHEGEAVVPKAYNPAAGGGGAGGNAELVAEVRALREAIAALQAAASKTADNTSLMPQMGRQFDAVTNGGTVLRNKAVA